MMRAFEEFRGAFGQRRRKLLAKQRFAATDCAASAGRGVVLVQFPGEELHEAGAGVEVFQHPGLLALAEFGEPPNAFPKGGSERRGSAFPMAVELQKRRGRFKRKQFQRVIETAARSIQSC